MKPASICPGDWKRLLVCSDGSDNAQVALAATLSLARLCGSQVYLVQVLHLIPDFGYSAYLIAELEKELEAQMEAVKAQAAPMGVALETRIMGGVSPLSGILEEAERLHPDLIIMGRSGRTGLPRLMMGSVTSRVIGYSPVTVLVIPLGADLAFSRLLLASDGSPCSLTAWEEALSMAGRAQSQLLAISVARNDSELPAAREILETLGAEASQKGVPVKTEALLGEPDEVIVQEARKHRAELIIMGSHGRTGLKKLLVGSVAERVIGLSPCPVLVAKKCPESG
jgi:nucleotide-binding universal stress UspA family protein